MNPSQRFASFLTNIVQSDQPVQIQMRSAPRQDGRLGRGFMNTLKVAIPSLLLVASAQTASAWPQVYLSVDGGHQKSLTEDMGEQIDLLANMHSTGMATSQALPDVRECFESGVTDAGLRDTNGKYTVLMVSAKVADVAQDMRDWASSTGRSMNTALAAFCANPNNWKSQVAKWDQGAAQLSPENRATMLAFNEHESLERYSAQTATQVHAIQYAQAIRNGEKVGLAEQLNSTWSAIVQSLADFHAEVYDNLATQVRPRNKF